MYVCMYCTFFLAESTVYFLFTGYYGSGVLVFSFYIARDNE